jgi:outer membrane murein-binding lipoprotein Lpp
LQGIFYDHLEYFMAVWYNLWPVGIVCGHLVCFSQFGMFGSRKNLATLFGRRIPSHQAHMYESLWPLVHLKFASIISVYTGAILRSRHISRQKMICMYAGKMPFQNRIAELKSQVSELKSHVSELKPHVQELKSHVSELKSYVSQLKSHVSEQAEIARLRTQTARLITKISRLRTKIAPLRTQIVQLRTKIARLTTQIACLRTS